MARIALVTKVWRSASSSCMHRKGRHARGAICCSCLQGRPVVQHLPLCLQGGFTTTLHAAVSLHALSSGLHRLLECSPHLQAGRTSLPTCVPALWHPPQGQRNLFVHHANFAFGSPCTCLKAECPCWLVTRCQTSCPPGRTGAETCLDAGTPPNCIKSIESLQFQALHFHLPAALHHHVLRRRRLPE